MLDCLPNELLVKVFGRTDESTNRQCRLLNSRMNCVIERDVLHKKKLHSMTISDPKGMNIVVQQPWSTVHIQCENNDGPTFCYQQMHNVNWTKILYQYRPSNKMELRLNKIHITKDLADQLSKFECVNKLDKLVINECTFDDDQCTDLTYFLNKIKVKILSIEVAKNKRYILPNEIFHCVSDQITIAPKKEKVTIVRHFDDESLDKWFIPEKSLEFGFCPTGFTTNGIKKQLQKLQHANPGQLANREWHFGMLFGDEVEFDEMLETFDKMKLTKTLVFANIPAFMYKISSINGVECEVYFMVLRYLDMLDCLPNEVLVKIFKKTDTSTNRQCRLLNSRIKSVIERDTLHKKELAFMGICAQAWKAVHIHCEPTDGPCCTYTMMENVNWTKIFKQYRNSRKMQLDLNGIRVTKYMVDQLAQFDCVNKLNWLVINKCTFDDIECTDLVYLLEKIKVKSLSIEPNHDKEYIIPNDIFRCVSHRIRITPEKYDVRTRHFDDELLDKWFNPAKTLAIIKFPTGFTVNGIKKQLQKLQNANPGLIAYREWHFGVIFDDAIKLDEMLGTFDKISWTKSSGSRSNLAIYEIYISINGAKCRVLFGVESNL